MKRVDIIKAKRHLSELLAEVEKGMTVTITRRDHAIAVLSPVNNMHAPRQAAAAALADIRGSQLQIVTADEIVSWKEEDRKF